MQYTQGYPRMMSHRQDAASLLTNKALNATFAMTEECHAMELESPAITRGASTPTRHPDEHYIALSSRAPQARRDPVQLAFTQTPLRSKEILHRIQPGLRLWSMLVNIVLQGGVKFLQ